jgi:hypothetical protein
MKRKTGPSPGQTFARRACRRAQPGPQFNRRVAEYARLRRRYFSRRARRGEAIDKKRRNTRQYVRGQNDSLHYLTASTAHMKPATKE